MERIEASNKLRVAYEWNGDKLKAIVPTFEKNDRVTGEQSISFAYDDGAPQVATISTGGRSRGGAGRRPRRAL